MQEKAARLNPLPLVRGCEATGVSGLADLAEQVNYGIFPRPFPPAHRVKGQVRETNHQTLSFCLWLVKAGSSHHLF